MTKLKKAIKFFLYGILLCIMLFSIALLYLDIKKDAIIPYLVERLNKNINGELQYDEIKLSPFSSFPNISISLTDPALLLKNESNTDTLMKFSQLDLQFDLLLLLQSEIDISYLKLHNGEVNLIQLPDSSYSLITALQNKIQETDTTKESYELSLDVENVSAENIHFQLHQLEKSGLLLTSIESLQASLFYSEDSISSLIKMTSTIDKLALNETEILKDAPFSIDGNVYYNRVKDELFLSQSTVHLMEAVFSFDGNIELSDEQNIDLHFSADDEDLKFTKLFLAEAKDTLIEKGNLFLKGEITGRMKDELPNISCSFGSKNLSLFIPKTNDKIQDLNIEGEFKSGNKRDLSNAVIRINSIEGELPEGSIKGSFSLRNFKNPYLDFSLDVKTRIDGLDDVIKMTAFDSLSGEISISGKYKGNLDVKDPIEKSDVDIMKIKLSNVSFNLINDFRFRSINGTIETHDLNLAIDSTRLVLNNAAIELKGSIENYFGLFISGEKPVIADLSIKTKHYDFQQFFSYSENISKSFPYQIEDVLLKVIVSTSKKGLSDFSILPSINFKIDQLSCNIPKICPPIDLKGNFKLGESDRIAQLEFTDFLMNLGANPVSLNLFYAYSEWSKDSLNISLDLDTFNVGKNIYFDFLSSLRDSSGLILDGNVKAEAVWNADSLKNFKTLDFSAEQIYFKRNKFWISTINSSFNGSDLRGFNDGEFPLSSMSGNIQIDFEKILTPIYEDQDVHFKIGIEEGQLALDVVYTQDPDDNFKINLDSRPFDSIPSYALKHNAENTSVQKVLTKKDNKSLQFGNTDLDIDIKFKGKTQDDILQSLNGTIVLKGDSLILKGYNIDDLIAKFERSQNFNLVDLGAVLVAGPAGILFTKGSDYAMILVNNKNDSSIINKFYSEWYIENGYFIAKDFAFATQENRIAIDGWINLNQDSLKLEIALIDEAGCSIASQTLEGNLDKPKPGKVKLVKTAIAPVTNLADKTLKIKCDVFYDGVVKPTPAAEKKEDL